MATLDLYNLHEHGVNVDSDSVHAPRGSFRQAQNIHRNPVLTAQESIITRDGLRDLNALALGSGAVLGGIVVPAFEAGDGTAILLLGFGD